MFTFKTEKPTGRYRSFENPVHRVKLKKIEIGTISPNPPHKIRLRVMKTEPDNSPCAWKWVYLKKESTSLQEAKEFLNEKFDLIIKKYTFPKD